MRNAHSRTARRCRDFLTPLGVLLFFTEDFGNSGYLEEASLHADVAKEHNLVLASMASPDAPGDAGCWWAPQVEDNAAYVDEFVQQRLVGDLGVDTERLFATGLSGGSDFAAAFHLHTDYRYGGGVVALCGGDIPRLNGGGCEPEANPDPAPAPTDKTSTGFVTTSRSSRTPPSSSTPRPRPPTTPTWASAPFATGSWTGADTAGSRAVGKASTYLPKEWTTSIPDPRRRRARGYVVKLKPVIQCMRCI